MILLDTHIWVWWVQGDKRLTPQHQVLLQAHQTDGLGISLKSFTLTAANRRSKNPQLQRCHNLELSTPRNFSDAQPNHRESV